MKIRVIVMFLMTIIVGCSTVPMRLQTPIQVIAIVSEPESTGWWKDFCSGGTLVPHLPDCIQLGGKVQRVKISNIETLNGEVIEGTVFVGLASSGFVSSYRGKMLIDLEVSPADFREATGLELVASDW